MPAQSGASILLSYGPQGAQQSGDAILLLYQAPAVSRRLSATTRAPWGASAPVSLTIRARHDPVTVLDKETAAPWGTGQAMDTEHAAPWGRITERDTEARAPWGRFDRVLQPESELPWGVAAKRDREADAPWGAYGAKLQPITLAPWVRSAKRDDERRAPWGGPMRALGLGVVAAFSASRPADRETLVPWAFYSRRLNPGWGIPTPPNPLPLPGETIIIPVRGVYIVQNEVLLTRVAGGATIPATRMSLSLDVDSWTWSFSASVPGQYLSLLEPSGGAAVEIEAIINGQQFRVLAERLSRDRAFGSSSIAVTGRGKAALLSAPYAPLMTFANDEARTAQQLAGDVLTLNGVPLDWTVNWGLTDWSVPTGVWNHQGSFMDGLVRIAEAAGAYIRPDPLLQELSFLHRYPTMPDTWASATPDYELPAAITTREAIEWQDRADYDAVYVSGQQQGVLGFVKKAGSAGETFAQMVTDALITHTDAARQRGRAILGNTGRKAIVTLSLPVLEETGVIEPGKMVEYVDGGTSRIGIVRSTSVDVQYPAVIQTIGVETHVA